MGVSRKWGVSKAGESLTARMTSHGSHQAATASLLRSPNRPVARAGTGTATALACETITPATIAMPSTEQKKLRRTRTLLMKAVIGYERLFRISERKGLGQPTMV